MDPVEPIVPQAVVEWLETLVPLRTPDLEWSDRKVWHYTGQRELVTFLRTTLDRQQSNILNKEIVPSVSV